MSRIYLLVWFIITAVILAGFYLSGGKVMLWEPPVWLFASVITGYSAGRLAQ